VVSEAKILYFSWIHGLE